MVVVGATVDNWTRSVVGGTEVVALLPAATAIIAIPAMKNMIPTANMTSVTIPTLEDFLPNVMP